MTESYEDERKYSWIVYATATLIVGGLAGYIIGIEGARPGNGSAAETDRRRAPRRRRWSTKVPCGRTATSSPAIRRTCRPRSTPANLLYDGQRYVEAIPFYEQAFALNSADINVSTDLGTALWYAGRPDEALAQYERSLKISPTHAQTLFNVGIVRAEGKHDYPGAVAAWESLLATSPAYPNAAGVRELLSDARAKSNIAAR